MIVAVVDRDHFKGAAKILLRCLRAKLDLEHHLFVTPHESPDVTICRLYLLAACIAFCLDSSLLEAQILVFLSHWNVFHTGQQSMDARLIQMRDSGRVVNLNAKVVNLLLQQIQR